MTHLSVNLNAIAMLRNRRSVPWPSVVGMARIALDAGADGITVHPRPDERHIRRTDVFELAALLKQDYPGREFNIEGYPSDDFLTLVRAGGAGAGDVRAGRSAAGDIGSWLGHRGEPGVAGVGDRANAQGRGAGVAVHRCRRRRAGGRDCGRGRSGGALYRALWWRSAAAEQGAYLAALKATADAAREAGHNARAAGQGLKVNAGHDLNLVNLPLLKAAVPDLAEVSIGHAITADALIYGMAEAVRLYKTACA